MFPARWLWLRGEVRERGDPPIWSPWNFQFPSSNREGQKRVYREAHGIAYARGEAK